MKYRIFSLSGLSNSEIHIALHAVIVINKIDPPRKINIICTCIMLTNDTHAINWFARVSNLLIYICKLHFPNTYPVILCTYQNLNIHINAMHEKKMHG